MELKDLKLINNGGIPELEQRLEDKIASTAIPLGGSTGKSTLADRKAIHNLPKFELGKPGPVLITGLGGGTTNNFNFAGRTSAAAQLGKGLTPDASKAIKDLPTGPSGGSNGGLNLKTLGTVGGAVASNLGLAIDFAGSIVNATQYNTTANDLLQDAGTSEGNIGGISYNRQNDINALQVAAQEHAENKANTIGLMGKGASLGSSIGSVAGPVGSAIGAAVGAVGGLVGGLFGSGRRHAAMRRRIAEAKDRAFRLNDYSRSGALTSALQQQYAQEFGDTESQSLYGYANGKRSFSAAGPTEGYNARVSNGEIIANKFTGEMFRVPGLPNNKDGKLALIRPTDTIITNKYGLSDYVAETGDLEGGEAMMSSIMKAKGKKGYKNGKQSYIQNDATRVQTPHTTFKIKRNKNFSDSQYFWNSGPMYPSGLLRLSDGSFSAIKPENGERIYFPQEVADSIIRNNIRKQEVEKFNNAIRNNEYKNGKLPGFNEGLWSNVIGHGLPLISEIIQGNKISKQQVKSPDTYSGNEFLNAALYTLGQQQENPYAIMPELYNEYAKGMYALSNNGGLSEGQRALARLTAMNNFMNQTAKLQQAAQSANIAHKQTFANAMLNTGALNATNRSAAKRYDLDYYSKAHAAKLAGEQEARKGAYAQLMAGIKGIVDNRRYDEAMGLYREKSKSEKDYYDALTRNLLGNKVTANNSKDWSWLPEVYGPLNKGVSIQAKPVNSGIYYNPMSFYGTGALSPMMYKYNGPKLTKPTVKLY